MVNNLNDLFCGHLLFRVNTEVTYGSTANCIFSTYSIPSSLRILKMCETIQRRLPHSSIQLHGSIPMHGICTINLPRKFKRYRSLSLHCTKKLYHMGFRGNISRCNIANANESRNWRIYADFALTLINTARKMYAKDSFGVEIDNMVYALDSTTIDLCLSLFPWAKFRTQKGAVKLHTLLDLRGSIPAFIQITDGSIHDVNIIDELQIEPGAIYIMDRGYLDCKRLHSIHISQATFITRCKRNTQVKRIYSRSVDKSTGLRYDQTVAFTSFYPKQYYPDHLRKIKYFDSQEKKQLVFLTNNFTLSALTIAQLYRCRWKVELFFKWIKMHLRIKTFYGTTENAVKTQIWIAISIYVLIAIVKKKLKIEMSLYSILQILSVTIFERLPINQILTDFKEQHETIDDEIQLNLFDF